MTTSPQLIGTGFERTVQASEMRDTISALFPEMEAHWHRPLRDYASSAYAVGWTDQENPIRQDCLRRMLSLVQSAALRAGYSTDEARQARDEFTQTPVLQTGPHCHLLIEPDAFYTHHFSLLGLKAHERRWHFWYGCSTVKLTESARKGPGWLRVGDDVVNVFGLSRRRMEKLSACGVEGEPIRFKPVAAPEAGADGDEMRMLASMLPQGDFTSPAEAIRTANIGLWKRGIGNDIHLLQLDDFDVADLLADHLDDASSWLATHLCEEQGFGENLLSGLARLDDGPWRGWIRRTTDLFWELSDGRLGPLQYREGKVPLLSGNSSVSFDPRSLAAALRRRRIVPSLLVTFLVLSVLPGIRVLGGCRQIVYYPLMRHVIAAALDRCGCRALSADLDCDRSPGLWGHRVLKPEVGNPLRELTASDIGGRLARFGALPLEEACGDLASFRKDTHWAAIGRDVISGNVTCDVPGLRGEQRR